MMTRVGLPTRQKNCLQATARRRAILAKATAYVRNARGPVKHKNPVKREKITDVYIEAPSDHAISSGGSIGTCALALPGLEKIEEANE